MSDAAGLPAPRSRTGLDPADLPTLVETNAALFRALDGAAVVLTGASGWFGVWLLDVLCAAADRLRLDLRLTAVSRRPEICLRRHPALAAEGRITWLAADVRTLPALPADTSHIIHAATESSSGGAAPPLREQFETIVDGTRRVLDAAGPNCRAFLMVSSGAVYGPARADGRPFIESDPGGPDPASASAVYAEGKRTAELCCTIAAAGGLPAKVARCFAFVGPHMPFDRHFAIGNFIADAARGRPVAVKSDGLSLRSYLYMTDLVAALVTVLVRGGAGRPYNVGSEHAVSIADLARLVDRIVGGRGVSIGGTPSNPRDRYLPDTGRLRTELGFSPQVTLEEAVAKTAAWYRENVPGGVS
jgi:nucleoside-diphosphate-sugar epimerase